MMPPPAPWTSSHRKYLLAEIVAGIVITTVLSGAFAWLVFGRSLPVGIDTTAFQIDAALQMAVVAFMSAVVPTALARKRLGRGVISPAGEPHAWPRGVVPRGAVVALAVALPTLAVHSGLVRMVPGLSLDLTGLLLWKSLLGALIAIPATALSVRLAIAD